LRKLLDWNSKRSELSGMEKERERMQNALTRKMV